MTRRPWQSSSTCWARTSERITHVSADGADFIDRVVAEKCPTAVRVADPFHVVKWATDALDELRRDAWNTARTMAKNDPKRSPGRPRADAPPRPGSEHATGLKGARYSLWKNPENLTENQQVKLTWIAQADPRLYRAYLLKEGLRVIFQLPYAAAAEALERWASWARRCRIPAFGFHSAAPLIALAMLTPVPTGRHCPAGINPQVCQERRKVRGIYSPIREQVNKYPAVASLS